MIVNIVLKGDNSHGGDQRHEKNHALIGNSSLKNQMYNKPILFIIKFLLSSWLIHNM